MGVQPPSHQTKRFILCFSPKDADGKAELMASLSPVSETVIIWSVDQVPYGEGSLDAFLRATSSADAALLLLSADFFAELNEPTFAKQVGHLRHEQIARGLALIPVLWRACEWQAVAWLSECQPLPSDRTALRSMRRRRRDRAWAELARQLDGRNPNLPVPNRAGQRQRRVIVLSLLILAGATGGTVALCPRIRDHLTTRLASSIAVSNHATLPDLREVDLIEPPSQRIRWKILTDPAGATVIDERGTQIGTTPWEDLHNAKEGEKVIRLRLNGYEESTIHLALNYDAEKTIELHLKNSAKPHSNNGKAEAVLDPHKRSLKNNLINNVTPPKKKHVVIYITAMHRDLIKLVFPDGSTEEKTAERRFRRAPDGRSVEDGAQVIFKLDLFPGKYGITCPGYSSENSEHELIIQESRDNYVASCFSD